ncbi:hypothetical protein M2651_10155 [Clostridium sp. SYSU_GA19001]|uniref:hypothetical protein n=1 Tax=Clostridium caldaquaticum TaxID=2940653 RepID=UPI00207791AA|nr:hypothetical protein [Clostridium caldaquaticum]MCM8711382.1 hypothetical protein [Clostridium caldaquaticum]
MSAIDIANIKYELTANNKLIKAIVDLKEKHASSIIDNELIIKFDLYDNMLNVSIKNISSMPVVLNNLRLNLFSTEYNKEAFFIINPKNFSEKITCMPIQKVNNEKIKSHLFEIFVDEENYVSKIFGFLGCQFSGNFIENVVKRNELKINAVYNFVNQELQPEEEFNLDAIYIKDGVNIFSLLNNFIDRMVCKFDTEEDYNKKLVLKKSDVYSILFTYRANKNTLKINNKPVCIKNGKKKLYAVDISNEEGKKQVFINANAVLTRANALDLNGICQLIKIIEDNKLFNVYFELNKLFILLKNHFKGVKFFSEDYPLGLFLDNIILENNKLALNEKKSFMSLISKRKDNYAINYDFFIKLVMQRIVSYSNQNVSMNNKKIDELMYIVSGGSNLELLSNKELINMAEDLDISHPIIPYIKNEKVFATLLTGKKYMYLAVFNLQKDIIKFYCDLKACSGYREKDGVATEIYSNNNYLISDGKIYIRDLSPMNCCLFKKIKVNPAV